MISGFSRFWKSAGLRKKAYEVFTLTIYRDVGRYFLKRYLVISTSTTKAVSMIKLMQGEEILEAKELTHEVVLK